MSLVLGFVFFNSFFQVILFALSLKLAPFVKSPDLSSLPFPKIFLTSSQPSLSILSRARNVTADCSLDSIFSSSKSSLVNFLDEILTV